MTVLQLKKVLEKLNDDVEVVSRANDHSFRHTSCEIVMAEMGAHYGELYEPDLTTPENKLVTVLVIE